ncbi:metallopeptidase family protein [Acaricomes phytoseiuli]|uniref:metallopeptidase family protein n=1 Tax=Acaricomes phytoseiuli TaxID=291968 RepID=UPI002221930E|nr:metallopeptidase family protein [Acaricomes phytoseiuli]MCW1249871.1 metallopeptidase family protein [Acaricomes phytoseiuli]
MESANRLQELWGSTLSHVEFVIDEIPDNLEELTAAHQLVPLASLRDESSSRPATVIIYRRPALQSAFDDEDLAELVHYAVVEQIAMFLNISPEAVDPRYRAE